MQSRWDHGKEKLKGIVINYCSRKASASKQCCSLLVNLAFHLKTKIDLGWISLLEVSESVQSRIVSIDLSAAEGASIRARVCWAEEEETSSCYFLRLEKKHGADAWILVMKNPDGSIASNIVDIGNSWVSFYSSLFTACETDSIVQNALLDQLSSSLFREQAGSCEGHISVNEAFCALSGMAKSKSPGSDGFPAEFYPYALLGP